jgi:hypothetical protein
VRPSGDAAAATAAEVMRRTPKQAKTISRRARQTTMRAGRGERWGAAAAGRPRVRGEGGGKGQHWAGG